MLYSFSVDKATEASVAVKKNVKEIKDNLLEPHKQFIN